MYHYIVLTVTFNIIFIFSAQDGEESSSISHKVTGFIVEIISKVKTLDINTKLEYIQKLHLIIRKLAHFGIYTVVGFSFMGFMCTFNMRNTHKIITSFGAGLIYAITDEIHQSFIPGRGPKTTDVLIDSAGVLTGIFLIIVFIIVSEKIENRFKR